MGVILFLLIYTLGFAQEKFYCVQVLSSRDLNSAKVVYENLSNYPYARVEKIGNYYTLRVGLWKSKQEAEEYFSEIKKLYPQSFLRTCYYLEERIVNINKAKTYRINVNFQGSRLILKGKSEESLICGAIKKVFEKHVSFEGSLIKKRITFKSYFPYSVADALNYALILNKREGFVPIKCRVLKKDDITYVLELEGIKNGKVANVKAVDYASVTYRRGVLKLKLIF